MPHFKLFDSISECIIIVNDESEIEYVNPALEDVFGYSSSELRNKSLNVLVPETFAPKHNGHIKSYFKNPITRQMGLGRELSGVHKGGDIFPIEVSLSPLEVKGRTLAVAIVVDVSEKIQKIDDLVFHKSLYASIVENTVDHILQIDRDLRIQYINHVSPGLKKEEVIGCRVIDFIQDEADKQMAKSKLESVLDTGEPTTYEVDYPSNDGPVCYMTTVSPVTKRGKIVGANLISRNITDLVQLKNKLIAKDQFFDKLSNYSINGLYIYSFSLGKNTFMNRSYARILGYTIDEVNDMSSAEFFNLFHPDDQDSIAIHMKKLSQLPEGESLGIEYRFKRKSGEWAWCKSVDGGFEYDKGKMVSFIGSFVDITDHKKAELKLLEKNKEIESFAFVASHDLKAPLSNIVAGLNYLQVENDKFTKDQQLMMEKVVASADHMNGMMTALLLHAQIDQGISFNKVNIKELIDELSSDLSNLIEENKGEITYGKMPIVEGSSGLIRVLFQNLLTNSLKYRHPKRAPKIDIQCEVKPRYWLFSFADNGMGIPEKDVESVFAMFNRSSREMRKKEGFGIGLANCKKIVKQHEGDIWVESKEGVGSTFYFTLKKMSK